jgi:AraC-like DNA-binding protein
MKKKDFELLAEIKHFLDVNLNKEIPVKDLCSKFAINKNKLQTGFKSVYRQTIHAYILHKKMEQAALMLTSSNDPVKAIALELGYTASNFHSKFKREFGCTPEQFRQLENVYKGN